jgi:CDP-glucose 4,6-dehydratase
MGTVNVLEGLRLLKHKCAAVLVTSDKCYDNLEWSWGYRETDKLGGKDPYSASKGAAELVIRSYFKSYFEDEPFVRVGIARAGNVIGGGDWASNRIIPDCAASWAKKKTVQLRNPNATRPWQHVLEPLGGYLRLATELYESEELQGEPFNFGPPSNDTYSVLELVEEMAKHWSDVKFDFIKENNAEMYESGLLKLNCDKALQYLNWKSVMSFRETVRLTADWYRSYYERKEDMRGVTFGQIEKYLQYLT